MTSARDAGLDFGNLQPELADESFPLSKQTLLETYGDNEIGTEGGTKTLREILQPLPEDRFEDHYDVHQTVLLMVDRSAEGRIGYSDRGGSGEGQSDQLSF